MMSRLLHPKLNNKMVGLRKLGEEKKDEREKSVVGRAKNVAFSSLGMASKE